MQKQNSLPHWRHTGKKEFVNHIFKILTTKRLRPKHLTSIKTLPNFAALKRQILSENFTMSGLKTLLRTNIFNISKRNILPKAIVAMTEHIPPKISFLNPKPFFPMNRFKPVIALVVLSFIGISFQNKDNPDNPTTENHLQLPEKDFSPSHRNGKAIEAERMNEVFSLSTWFDLGFPEITQETVLALKHHRHVLGSDRFKDGRKVGNLNVNSADFGTVIDLLIYREGLRPMTFTNIWKHIRCMEVTKKEMCFSRVITRPF